MTNTLNITVSDFITMLNDNADKSIDNIKINGILISIVTKYNNRMTPKQRKWVIDKINYIIRQQKKIKNPKYKTLTKITDIVFC